MWGTTVIANDDGTWEGGCVGSTHGNGTHLAYQTLTGTATTRAFATDSSPCSVTPGVPEEPLRAGGLDRTDRANLSGNAKPGWRASEANRLRRSTKARCPSDIRNRCRSGSHCIAGVTSDPNARYPPHVVPERAERLQ
jgi:hypothetical protein